MVDVYVLDEDLNQIGIIDSYTSLIWANRYQAKGDCELYIEATSENLDLLQKGHYLSRHDDDMVCRIEKLELDTDVEKGNYIIATGYDVKKLLDQRIIWGQSNVDGNVEDYIRSFVYNSMVDPTLSARQIRNSDGVGMFLLGTAAGFNEVTTEQVSYKNVGEKIREYCDKYHWGYKVIVNNKKFYFVLYKGTNRSELVIFSPDYENLLSTKYVNDSSNQANVALVAGAGEGSARSRNVSGYEESVNRYEVYVDARDVSKTITWSTLTTMYPTTEQGGQGYITTEGTAYVYKMNYIDIQIVDNNQLTELQIAFPDGTQITVDGNLYYRVYNATIADLPSDTLEENDDVILRDLVYSVYLLTRGYEKLAEYGTTESFEGSIEPNTTFVYKTDYFLGDLVMVQNEFGISAEARIVEVIEVYDENGYSIEPKFEYKNEIIVDGNALTTETNDALTTETNDILITEGGS